VDIVASCFQFVVFKAFKAFKIFKAFKVFKAVKADKAFALKNGLFQSRLVRNMIISV
jgi:hypothetical protein